MIPFSERSTLLAQLLNLPGYPNITGTPGLKPVFTNIGSFISQVLSVVFLLAVILAFLLLLMGGLQYLFAGGNKEGLDKARGRITWAIVGLIIVIAAYFITAFVGSILGPRSGTIPLTVPGFGFVGVVYAQSPSPTPVDLGATYSFGNYQTLGELVSKLLPQIFSIAGVGVIGFFIFGAFKFLTSGGAKESLETAQKMITGAVVGFIILILAFLVVQFLLFRLFGIENLNIIGIPKMPSFP